MANPAPIPTMTASLFTDTEPVLQAPPGHVASVVLRLVETDTVAKQFRYTWWALAGRDGALAVKVTFANKGGELIRVDVPTAEQLNHADLLAAMKVLFKQLERLPPDTPVIKGVTG